MDLHLAKAAARLAGANADTAGSLAETNYERNVASAIQLIASSLLQLETALEAERK